jgi:hypothetical protein
LPANINYVTLVVSMAAPVIYLLSAFDTKPFPVLFGQSTDAQYNAGAVRRRKATRFKLSSGIEINDPRAAFQDALHDMRQNIRLIAATLQTLTKARLLVCFKPNPFWIDKPLAPQERQVMEIFEKKHQTHIALTQDPELRPYWMEFISQIEKLADECASDFIDFNQIPELKSRNGCFMIISIKTRKVFRTLRGPLANGQTCHRRRPYE